MNAYIHLVKVAFLAPVIAAAHGYFGPFISIFAHFTRFGVIKTYVGVI